MSFYDDPDDAVVEAANDRDRAVAALEAMQARAESAEELVAAGRQLRRAVRIALMTGDTYGQRRWQEIMDATVAYDTAVGEGTNGGPATGRVHDGAWDNPTDTERGYTR